MPHRKAALQQLDVAAILEHVAGRLGIDHGERKLTVTFSDGALRRSFVELGPLRPGELAEIDVARAAAGFPARDGG